MPAKKPEAVAEDEAPKVAEERQPKGPPIEFIDSSDPEWKEFVKSDEPLMLNGVQFGTLRKDDEGHATLIIMGGSVNLAVDQDKKFKAALKSAVSGWPTGAPADIGYSGSVKMGVDPDTEDPLLVIRNAGMVRLTKEQAEVVLGLL